MPDYLVLLAPSANRVYTDQAPEIAAAELALLAPGLTDIHPARLAGVDYLAATGELDPVALSAFSARLAVFERREDLLAPVAVPTFDVFADDLVSIPKYPGKTNEQFTRLLLNVTIAAVERKGPFTVLDPLCGRGTTLSTAWTLGHDGAGVESDVGALDAYQAFLRTYLKRKGIGHQVEQQPVRRDGRSLGRKLVATARPTGTGGRELTLTVFSGDARESGALFGKRTFDAIVTDAPYGVVHSSQSGPGRDRSPGTLLREALPVWAGQLRSGGALGISWNTYGLPREALVELVTATGLIVADGPSYLGFGHRVDSSIYRDLLIASKPR